MNPQLVKSEQLIVNSEQLTVNNISSGSSTIIEQEKILVTEGQRLSNRADGQGGTGNWQTENLPCLDSSVDCVDKLTLIAVNNSLEIEALNSQIAMLGDRDELLSDRINYTRSNQWVNLLENPMTNPVGFIQNIFGGGNYQRSEIAITDLEIKKSQLEAYGADLTRRKAEVESTLKQEILTLLLSYERENRQQQLLLTQVENQSILSNVVEIDYRFGGSSTESYLASIEKQERLQNQLNQSVINQQESVRKLGSLVGI